VGLYLLLRPSRRPFTIAGAVLGLGAVAWLLFRAAAGAGTPEQRPEIFFVIFSLIAVASAVRMITHSQPVYSALYFILVVLSSAGLFLLLQAEFMAFALVIVYAGAILVTYVFVLMLAQQRSEPHDASDQPEYDRVPREPGAGALVGFVMLALFGTMIFHERPLTAPPSLAESSSAMWYQLEQMPRRLEEQILALEPAFNWPPNETPAGHWVLPAADGTASVEGTVGDDATITRLQLPVEALPENVQRVGLALVADFPVSLELAGVILLLAMFGAVVLARKQIELGEDEVREAAGLPRFGFEDDDHGGEGAAGTGATS
jgi:NADH-quinone oxidoreductase subunit J